MVTSNLLIGSSFPLKCQPFYETAQVEKHVCKGVIWNLFSLIGNIRTIAPMFLRGVRGSFDKSLKRHFFKRAERSSKSAMGIFLQGNHYQSNLIRCICHPSILILFNSESPYTLESLLGVISSLGSTCPVPKARFNATPLPRHTFATATTPQPLQYTARNHHIWISPYDISLMDSTKLIWDGHLEFLSTTR